MDLKKIKDWAKHLLGLTPDPITGTADIPGQPYKREAGPQGAMVGKMEVTPTPDAGVVDPSTFRPDQDQEDVWAQSLLNSYMLDLLTWDKNSPDVQEGTLKQMKPLDRAMFLEAIEIYKKRETMGSGKGYDRWLKMFHQDKTGGGII